MLTSGTIQSDLKQAILDMDSESSFGDTLQLFPKGTEYFKNELCNLRDAIIDFLIIQIEPGKVKAEKDFKIVSLALYRKYLAIMLEATKP